MARKISAYLSDEIRLDIKESLKIYCDTAKKLAALLPKEDIDPTSVEFENLLHENPGLADKITTCTATMAEAYGNLVIDFLSQVHHQAALLLRSEPPPIHFEWDVIVAQTLSQSSDFATLFESVQKKILKTIKEAGE